MRQIFAVLVLFASFAVANELVDIYRKDGIEAVEKRANEILATKDYWANKLENLDTRFGYFEMEKNLFVIDKANRLFSYYDYIDGKLEHIADHKATLGDAVGDKFVEGDLKTPVGAYKITSKLTREKNRLDPYYGPLAFTTNYPNYLDRKLKKTGHGIWIHGFPLDRARHTENSEGCVVIDNESLSKIDTQVKHQDIIALINEEGILEAKRDDLASILALLFGWKNSWIDNDIERYLEFYSDDFTRHDGLKLEPFKTMKRQIFSRKEQKSIDFLNIEIVPYPNSLEEELFFVRYWQDYKAPSHISHRTKELYVRKLNDEFRIVLEY